MIYSGYDLLAHLRLLTLTGQNSDGELEWIGTTEQWNKLDFEKECILRDWDLLKFNKNGERH